MAQISVDLYELIAKNIHSARDEMLGTDAYVQTALEGVVDVTTSNYIPAGDSSASSDAAVW